MRPTGVSHVDTVSMIKAQVISRHVFARGFTVTVLGKFLRSVRSNNLVIDDVIPLFLDNSTGLTLLSLIMYYVANAA
jgi:hypothetical protein